MVLITLLLSLWLPVDSTGYREIYPKFNLFELLLIMYLVWVYNLFLSGEPFSFYFYVDWVKFLTNLISGKLNGVLSFSILTRFNGHFCYGNYRSHSLFILSSLCAIYLLLNPFLLKLIVSLIIFYYSFIFSFSHSLHCIFYIFFFNNILLLYCILLFIVLDFKAG